MADNALTVSVPAPETTAEAPPIPAEAPAAHAAEDDAQARTEQDRTESDAPEQDEEQAPQDAPAREAAEDALKDKGLDITEFEAEFTARGELSAESYQKLLDKGIPRALVDSYIAGQKALVDSFVQDIHAIAGGPDAYADMVAWARQSLSPAEIAAFDRIANAGQKDMLELAVTGLAARWKAAEGSRPELVRGKATAGRGGSPDVFESPQQVVEAMRDKRYGKDPAYTQAIADKMARSNVFGG